VKDVLTRSKTFSLRNHWDSEKGESNIAVAKSIFNINLVASTNVDYPDKSTPLMTRFIVDDVVQHKENAFSVRDIAWVLQHQKDIELEELVQREHKVRQSMHSMVELFITSMAINDVNLDIPVLLLPGVTDFLQDKYGIPPPDLKKVGMILNACRVETIQHAIRVKYFSEIGQVRHQFVTRKGEDGTETIVIDRKTKEPKKKRFDVSTLPHEIEPMLFCTEDIFAYIMKLFESQFVPCVTGEVRKAIIRLIDKMRPGLHKLKMRTENGIWYDTFDPKYLEITYTSHEKFYRDIADQTGGKINTITVKSAIREINDKPIITNALPRLKRRADKSSSIVVSGGVPVTTTPSGVCPYEIMDDSVEEARMSGKSPKKNSVYPIVFNKAKEGNGVVVCIARCLIEKELPTHIPVVNPETGGYTRGEPIGVNYGHAMKDALRHAMSHYATRPRRVIIPGTLFTRGKRYPELLDYIDLERNEKRVIVRINHLAPQSTRALFVDYTAPTKKRTQGFRSPVQIVDTDMETIVARNHARAIGREFDPIVLPAVQEQIITQFREDLPDIFDNETVLYPEEMSVLMDMDTSRTTMVSNTIKKAAKEGNLESVISDKRYASFLMSNAYKTKYDDIGEGVMGDDDHLGVWGTEDIDLVHEAIMEEEEKMTSEFSSLQEVTLSSHKKKEEEPKTASEMDSVNQSGMQRLREGDAILKRIKENQRYSGRYFTPPPPSVIPSMVARDFEGETLFQVEKAKESFPKLVAPPTTKRPRISQRLQLIRRYNETIEKNKKRKEEMRRKQREEEKTPSPNHESGGEAFECPEYSVVNSIMTGVVLNKSRQMTNNNNSDNIWGEDDGENMVVVSGDVMKEGDSSTMMGDDDDSNSSSSNQQYDTNDMPEAETLALFANF
jgi:hypothetical protein